MQLTGSDIFTLSHNGNQISDTIATLPAGHSATFIITVAINGQNSTFAAADVTSIVVQTIDGNDAVTNKTNLPSTIFGGEGLFLAKLTGPGTVYLQSLPFSRLADRIISASRWGGGREESRGIGGLLGGLISGRE